MSDYTKLTKDPILGNGLAASKDLHAGEVIVKITEPLLTVVEQDALDRVCSFCLMEKDPSSLKRCTGCKIVRYCSPMCQKADWKLIHKNECSLLQKLPGIPPTPVRAMYQLLLRNRGQGAELDPRSATLENHAHHLKKDKKRWDDIVLQARAAIDFSKSSLTKMEMVTSLLCIMAANAFRVTLPDDSPVGLCYEPILALVNHSCSPNAFIMFDGRQISLMALDAIKKDEDIFISYIDFTQLRDVRRAELHQRYFFKCNCEKCKNDDSPYQTFLKNSSSNSIKLNLLINRKLLESHAESRIMPMEGTAKEIESLKSVTSTVYTIIDLSRAANSQSKRLELLKQALSDLSLFKIHQLFALPPYPTTLDEIYLTYIDNDILPSALIVLLFIFLNCDVFNWPQPSHPIRVTRLFTIARLLKYVASLEVATLKHALGVVPQEALEGIDFIDAVHAFLILTHELAPISHGAGTVFMRQVEEELQEVEEVQRLRGGTGDALRKWQSKGESANEGSMIARKTFEGLRVLAGFAFDVISKQTV